MSCTTDWDDTDQHEKILSLRRTRDLFTNAQGRGHFTERRFSRFIARKSGMECCDLRVDAAQNFFVVIQTGKEWVGIPFDV
jgi:hypothetical protein